jgi:hypothetical protein
MRGWGGIAAVVPRPLWICNCREAKRWARAVHWFAAINTIVNKSAIRIGFSSSWCCGKDCLPVLCCLLCFHLFYHAAILPMLLIVLVLILSAGVKCQYLALQFSREESSGVSMLAKVL